MIKRMNIICYYTFSRSSTT